MCWKIQKETNESNYLVFNMSIQHPIKLFGVNNPLEKELTKLINEYIKLSTVTWLNRKRKKSAEILILLSDHKVWSEQNENPFCKW